MEAIQIWIPIVDPDFSFIKTTGAIFIKFEPQTNVPENALTIWKQSETRSRFLIRISVTSKLLKASSQNFSHRRTLDPGGPHAILEEIRVWIQIFYSLSAYSKLVFDSWKTGSTCLSNVCLLAAFTTSPTSFAASSPNLVEAWSATPE